MHCSILVALTLLPSCLLHAVCLHACCLHASVCACASSHHRDFYQNIVKIARCVTLNQVRTMVHRQVSTIVHSLDSTNTWGTVKSICVCLFAGQNSQQMGGAMRQAQAAALSHSTPASDHADAMGVMPCFQPSLSRAFHCHCLSLVALCLRPPPVIASHLISLHCIARPEASLVSMARTASAKWASLLCRSVSGFTHSLAGRPVTQCTLSVWYTSRQEGRQAGRQEGKLAGRQAGWLAGRQVGRQTGWQAGRQAGGQVGEQADRVLQCALVSTRVT